MLRKHRVVGSIPTRGLLLRLVACRFAMSSSHKHVSPHCIHRAHGVVVSHPLRMRKALGSNPSVSMHNVNHCPTICRRPATPHRNSESKAVPARIALSSMSLRLQAPALVRDRPCPERMPQGKRKLSTATRVRGPSCKINHASHCIVHGHAGD